MFTLSPLNSEGLLGGDAGLLTLVLSTGFVDGEFYP
jgi:hypothetical protein